MSEPAVRMERQGNIAVITLNRPEAKNAVNPEVCGRLTDIWKEVRDNGDIYCAIVTGAGDAFCAGADLAQLVPLMTGARQPENEWDKKVLENPMLASHVWMRDFDPQKPIIAAVNGFCLAGGLEMITATDIRVAADSAIFGLQEAKWSLFPLGGSTIRLPWMVSFPRAMEIALTARQFTAAEALEWGLLNKVVPRAQVMDEAMKYAEMIAANGPLAVRAIRKAIRKFIGLTIDEAYPLEQEIGYPIFMSEDAKEGPRAFKQKRKPVWKGK
ncbi:MAG: enoyl-CoA hydratase/isomerase family protein [Myxococcales bacterium]|nr:enoyl-CoA hydratase/isomerase family protein [Myxococcales bacterium]